jgi:hypothetical protein
MRRTARTAAVSMMVLLVLCTVVSVQAQTPDNGQGNSNIIAQNMDTNTGNPPASMVASYLNPDGSSADSLGTSVSPLAAKEFAISQTGIGEPWAGSAILYSTAELASVVNLLYQGGASPGDKTAAAYAGFSNTADLWYLPFVFVKHGRQVGQISVQNADEETATVCIRYRQRNTGTVTAEACEAIEAGGSRFYDLGSPGGNVPDLAGLIGLANWTGSAEVEAADGKQITVVLVNQQKNSRTMAYVGITQPSYTLIAPRVSRRALYNSAGIVRWKKYGVISLQNPNAGTATVDVSFYAQGVLSKRVEDLAIGAYDMATVNLMSGGDVPLAELDPVDAEPGDEIRWEGAVVVESDLPIAGIVMPDYQPRGAASMYNMIDPAQGSDTLYVPSLYRVACGSKYCPLSRLSVMNLSAVEADVDFYFYDRDGVLVGTKGKGLSGNRVFPMNMNKTDYDFLGNSFQGSVYVTSNQPIAAVVDTMWTETYEQSTYNAIND